MDAMSERSLTVQKEAEERVSGLPDSIELIDQPRHPATAVTPR